MEAPARQIASRGDSAERLRIAAERLFLEHGYAATSTDALCREARVSKESLYTYYGGKEGLLAAVLRHLIEDQTAESSKPIRRRKARSLRDELLAYSSTLVDSLMQPKYLALARLVVSEVPRQPQLGELFRSSMAERAFRGATEILDAHGAARRVDSNVAARSFVGGLLTYVLLDGLLNATEPRKPPRSRVAAHVDLFLAAIGA